MKRRIKGEDIITFLVMLALVSLTFIIPLAVRVLL